jgi:DNA-binding MarR family transcriptional regulator
MFDDPDFLKFVREAVRSVWGVELLLLLRRSEPRAWAPQELVKEMRASQAVVDEALARLEAAGLVTRTDGAASFAPASAALADLTEKLEMSYREKPVRLINAIVSSEEDKLRMLADAFRLKDRRP